MRRISFSLTEPQFLDGTKTETRRLGWRKLKRGDELLAVHKCMGLKKGEKQRVLGKLRVAYVRRERLDYIEPREVRREGFPDMTPSQFVAMFCREMKCRPSTHITVIGFQKVAHE